MAQNHCIYGSSVHPHAGWVPNSKSIEFTSHKLRNPDVCIAYLPDAWNKPYMESEILEPQVEGSVK